MESTKKQQAPQTTEHEEIITTHMNADFDALASMIAARKLYPASTLVFAGSQEKNLKNFFLHSASYLFNFTKLKQIDLSSVRRLILVDTRQRSRIGKLAELVDNKNVEIHIYDHHHDSEDDIHGDTEVIRQVGSTTTILTEILKEKSISLSPDEATIMYLGIHEDTGSLTFASTTPDDCRAAAWLLEQGANPNLVPDMLTRELTAEQVWLLNDLTTSATKQVVNGVEVVIAKVAREEYIGDFAVVVHKFTEMENLKVIVALAQMEDKVYLVARSRTEDVNVAEIALAFGGGGHPQAASATIRNNTLIQVEKSLQTLLGSGIVPQKKAKDMMSSPVIHISPHATIQEATLALTKYNINVLLVIDEHEKLTGYVTRQVVEKAIHFGLGYLPIEEYANIEFPSVSPAATLKEVQELIIADKVRILPVVENGKVLGVITRTDLLNILVGGPVIPDFLYESRHDSHFLKKKNMATLLKERLPKSFNHFLKNIGEVGDALGYNVYLVGGLVRDILLKRENLDVDVVVEGDGIRFAQEFAKRQEVKVRSHKKFGTAVLIFPDGFKADVATARLEYYESPAALPNVEMSSLKLDLYRRDFTINTLAVKLNQRDYGTLVDYFGAQKDIKEKVIRVLHNLSFVEDPTRVLRAIRFEQRFGFKIGKLSLALIKNAVLINAFKGLSGRRLFIELKLLLMEQEPTKAIARMAEFNLLQFISPHITLTPDLRDLLEEIRGVLSWFDLLYLEEAYEPWKVYWHGLTSGLDATGVEELARHLQMGDSESAAMISQHLGSARLLEQLFRSADGNHYELYKFLTPFDTETLLYVMAKTSNRTIKRMVSKYFTRLKGSKTLLRGKDLKEMGFKPGPFYREVLDALLSARLNNEVNTREDEVEFVTQRFGNSLQKKS